MSDWFITDDDCLQCCRPDTTSDTPTFSFVQISAFVVEDNGKENWWVSSGTINVADYSEAEILSALKFFGYEDMADFVQQNTPDGQEIDANNQLIAEMLFEIDAITEFNESCHSVRNDAVRRVAEITGLDLEKYLEKESLSQRIQDAEEKASLSESGKNIGIDRTR